MVFGAPVFDVAVIWLIAAASGRHNTAAVL
jgi:hypothetical protein